MRKESANMDKQEWQKLFDYNANRELMNEAEWRKKYSQINRDMERKQNNYKQQVLHRQDHESHIRKQNMLHPDRQEAVKQQAEFQNNFYTIQDNLQATRNSE
mmetsp:Transcript_5455/g.8492  ORF Transcript_5455/g.8492 Transcript_5455/m.8492 type:complete len:102 (+) Transcript_5455:275-580(+)